MPNNVPPATDGQQLERKRRLFEERARCDYGLFLGAGEQALPRPEDAAEAVGLKLYLTPTFGPLRLESLGALLAIFRSWPAARPIAVHAEGMSMAVPILLAELMGRRVHLCHVARADEITLVRAAKERGVAVTCEVAPHHLYLTREDARALGALGQMKPPLGGAEDVDALWRNLGVVVLVASDHAPHTLAEKQSAQPPPGVPGVETMLPLLVTAVHEGRLSADRLVELLREGPQRVYGVRAPEATVEIEIGGPFEIRAANLHTRCGWTPFEGRRVNARVRRVVLRGRTVFEDGHVLGGPGLGRQLRPA
jgi:carbamoyl-phosphate synthase/aspartate carbamoyltransferase/dihydroorotase